MATVYINDFNDPVYQYKVVGDPPVLEKVVTAFEPAYSQSIYAGDGSVNGPIEIERFGSMLAGVTPNPQPPTTILVEEAAPRLCVGPSGTVLTSQTGAAVTVNASAASAAQDQSLGFFLLPTSFKIAAIDATLTFDTPTATTADKWAVALVLKSGDATDKASDERLGIDTQFKAGGAYIALLTPPGVVATPPVATTEVDSGKTFADYKNNCTQFILHFSIRPNPQGTLTATGTLQVGSAAPFSPVPSFNINLPNLSWVTAIGTSITTTAPIQMGVTYRQFTINSVTLVP